MVGGGRRVHCVIRHGYSHASRLHEKADILIKVALLKYAFKGVKQNDATLIMLRILRHQNKLP